MKKWIVFSALCVIAISCGKKSEEPATLTPSQELAVVDSATHETNARIDSLTQSVDDLQTEIDSLLNENK